MDVLIIDDDQDLCFLLKRIFEKKGCNVFTSGLLTEGLSLIDEHEPAIVFIDNYLPDGEGWSTAKIINKKHPKIRINLMSAMDKSFMNLESLENAIWEKPIRPEQIETYFSFLKF